MEQRKGHVIAVLAGILLIAYTLLVFGTAMINVGVSQLNLGIHFPTVGEAFMFSALSWAFYPICYGMEFLLGIIYVLIRVKVPKIIVAFINKVLFVGALTVVMKMVTNFIPGLDLTWLHLGILAFLYFFIVEQIVNFILKILAPNNKTQEN